jgi:hypothetical protein
VSWPASPHGKGAGAPQINFIGYRIGQGTTNVPLEVQTPTTSVRNDFTTGFDKGGSHTLKLGAEYLFTDAQGLLFCSNRNGTYDAMGGPIPANIESLFPVWDDVATWNLAAISPIVRRYTSSTGDCHTHMPNHLYAGWVQDDWQVTNNLTLNLGIRYDLSLGSFAEDVAVPPFVEAGRPIDTNNIGPRIGVNLALNPHTVLRGGVGKYYGMVAENVAQQPVIWSQQASVEVQNDFRANFAADPFNGPRPTYEQALARSCDVNSVTGCLRRTFASLPGPGARLPTSYQASIGLQRQITTTAAFEADYVYNRLYDDIVNQNINLGYNPATGVNYPFGNTATRPFPNFGSVTMGFPIGRSSYHGLQTSFTKRLSNQWQASVSYTLSGFWDLDPKPQVVEIDASGKVTGYHELPFDVPADLGNGEWTFADTDQRHRAVVNGIWQLPYGFQLSGIYLYGSGFRFVTTYGGDPRGTGGGSSRLRPDGSIVERNSFVGRPVHRADMRLQNRQTIGGVNVTGMLEVFNVFNHENYSNYVTQQSLSNYGAPSADPILGNTPRMLQLGFRVAF